MTGSRPIIKYTIAVDSDGTRETQRNLNSVASLDSSAPNINDTQELFKFTETSFQNYDYPLPPLDTNVEGQYTLTLGN